PELPVPMPSFVPLRRSTRDHHPSIRYSVNEYVLLIDEGEPECYAEAIEDEHKKEWFKAMQDEMNSLHENNTFELVKGKEDYVCRLQKSLYGLKQAPRQWYKKFESVIGKQGFRKTSSDHCVFFQRFGDDDFIILLLYVDDMLI
nr:reverse transcriptase [Tanacetum cinerariifolium]